MEAPDAASPSVPDPAPPPFVLPDGGDEGFTPRGQRTRARLVASAHEVLEDVGYVHATVTMITQRSGVSLGTFYRYFDNKEQLFLLLLRSLVDTLYDSVSGTWDPGDVPGSLYESTRRYLHAYYQNRRLISALRDMASSVPEAASLWWELRHQTHRRMGRHAPARRAEDPAGEPSLAVGALAGMVEQFAYHWYVEAERYGHHPPTIEEGAAELSRLWYRAIYA